MSLSQGSIYLPSPQAFITVFLNTPNQILDPSNLPPPPAPAIYYSSSHLDNKPAARLGVTNSMTSLSTLTGSKHKILPPPCPTTRTHAIRRPRSGLAYMAKASFPTIYHSSTHSSIFRAHQRTNSVCATTVSSRTRV
jgi:hypothetical protein